MIGFLKKHKVKVIIISAILLTLTAAFFLGEDSAKPNKNPENSYISAVTESSAAEPSVSDQPSNKNESCTLDDNSDISEQSITSQDQNYSSSQQTSENDQQISETEEKNNTETSVPDNFESSVNSADISQEISKDKDELICTISISCAVILNNMDKLDKSKAGVIPPDGWILKEIDIKCSEGESVFDVLKRACIEQKIHLEFSKTPAYDSVYIEGINNIYEYDCGSVSGWMYRVNGVYNNYSCSELTVNDGDKIEWLYTCDLGQDIGRTF